MLANRFHKWLFPLSNHFYKRMSDASGNNLISQLSLATATASSQNLVIANRGPGGTANCGPPPPAAFQERRRPGVK
jgi:hypothetical protein